VLAKQRRRLAYCLILPALILVLLLNVYPIIEAVIVSMQRQNMIRPNPTGFVGFMHYRRLLFEDDDFFESLQLTLIWTIGSVAGAYLVGLGLALLLNQHIRARGFFRALFLIPWVIPDVCTALVWKWLYGDELGVLNFLLKQTGIITTPILWLSDTDMAMAAVTIVQIWKLYPVMFIVLLAALQTVPEELHEAAMLDGATAWQRFRHITMPFLRPTSIVITLLASIWTFQSFDIIYLLTGGGPAGATKVLATLVYEKGFVSFDVGYAAALGMLMLGCLLILGVAYLAAYRARDAQA
jgi:multiple sugar transport system permease protein